MLIRLLTSSAALVFAATVANAADMPVKARPVLPEAAPQVSGYVEVYGGWASTRFSASECIVGGPCDTFSQRIRGWALGGAGRGNYWIAPNMSVQLDAQAEGTSYEIDVGPTSINSSNHSYLIGGHMNWRDSQRGLIGVFAGAGDAGGLSFLGSQRHVVAGGEAQLYWNQFTFYVQGGYDTVTGDSFIEPSAWFVRGTGRYFLTPNTMLEGTVLYANGEVDFREIGPAVSWGFDTWLWEAKLEHRFATTPFSGFVKYRGSQTEYDRLFDGNSFTEGKVTDHRVVVGLRLYMGDNTLLSNDRRGATLDIIDPLSIQSGPLMGGTPIGLQVP